MRKMLLPLLFVLYAVCFVPFSQTPYFRAKYMEMRGAMNKFQDSMRMRWRMFLDDGTLSHDDFAPLFILPTYDRFSLSRIPSRNGIVIWENPRLDDKLRRAFAAAEYTTKRFYAAVTGKSCAVVASSSNLRGAGYGALIDSYEVVWRMNQSPVGGEYARDVGTRTTVRLVNYMMTPDATTDISPSDRGQFIIIRELVLDRNRRRRGIPNLMKFIDRYPSSLVFTNTWAMNKLMYDIALYQIDPFPSSGLATLFIALSRCKSVDVFGFGPDKNGVRGYYYDKSHYPFGPNGRDNQRSFNSHSPPKQDLFIDKLEKNHLIRVYRGNRSWHLNMRKSGR